MGVTATQMERRGLATEKGIVNREIAAQNRLLKEIKARITAFTIGQQVNIVYNFVGEIEK